MNTLRTGFDWFPVFALFASTSLVPTRPALSAEPSSDIPDRRDFPLSSRVNPCENFYEYTCSEVNASFKLRDDRSRHTFAFSDSAERLLDLKKKYFSHLLTQKPASSTEARLKSLYASCMNESAKKNEEQDWVKKTFQTVKNLKSPADFRQYLGNSIATEKANPISVGTISNQDRPRKNDLYMESEWMSLPERSYYEKQDVVKDLRATIELFFKTINLDQPEQRAQKIIDFETGLAKAYPLPQDFRHLVASRTEIKKSELIQRYAMLNLKPFLASIPQTTLIRNFIPDALVYLNSSIQTLSEKDPETLRSLILYNTLADLMDDAYPEYFQARFQFKQKHLGGPISRPARDERCTKAVMSLMDHEVDSILWPRVFPNFPRARVVKLAEKIRATLIKSLENNTWLSKSARQAAIRKIKTAGLQLVAPRSAKEWHFKPIVTISESTPISNFKRISIAALRQDLAELKTETPPERWSMGPLTVNAYYNPPFNKFVLPVGILQYPFFDDKLSDEENLAAIGTVVGHELGHGIDDKGSKYDSNGKLNQWMTDADLKEFHRRGEKLIKQFNAIGHNGELTLGENIGDLVGVTSSLRAAFPSGTPDPKKLKLYFEQYGRLWCEVQRPKMAEMRLKTDPHSLGVARVNEQIRQQPLFKKTYHCKDGDPMTLPESDLAEIW